MTAESAPNRRVDSGDSPETVQLLVADAGNRSAIRSMLADRFDVETSQSVTDADLYLIEDHLFAEFRAALGERVEQEEPAFCPIVLIRHEKTDLRQESVDPSASDGRAHYDEVVDAPIDPAQLLQRLHSLLVRRRQSKELLQQISTLEEREQRLRLFEQGVESTGNGVVMTDTVGTIEYVNPAFASIAGYTEEEVLGASSQILLPGGSGKVFDEEFWRTIRDQGEWEGDIVIERKNSQRRVVNATATALRDADRETEGFVIVLKDITERIQREHELEDREEELDLLRQILTRHLRHNLRNDLTVIQGNAQMLVEDETLSPSQVELAETITEKSDVLIKTSETARTYSRLLERDVALSSFDMSELTMNAAQTVREEYSDVDFEIDVPETCPIQAREGIQRAVEELIENAARHNDARDPWVRIDVHDRDGARLLIEDNGPGISEQERDSLERGTETKLTHSQGVGLWLSKWVIEGVDGRLSIDTTDAGTRVRADFPATATVGSSGLTATTLKERERRLQTITDRMTDATLEIDAGWEITGLDTRAEGILDVNAGEVTGSSLWDVVPDLRGSHFETVVREAMESRSSMSVEEEFAGIDAWLEVNVYPEFNGGLSVYIRDVTDRIEREEALQDTKQRLETIIELSPAPVLALDSSGTVCVWNEAAEDVFGYTATDAIGERLESLDLFTGEASTRFGDRFERVVSGETIRGLEVERQRSDGSTLSLSVSASPLQMAAGDETGVLAVAQDITALKERQRDLQERVKELSAIHATTDLFQSTDAPVEALLSEFVETIPESFQYPEITTARVRYDDFEASTTNFESREHVLTRQATLNDGSALELAVGYLSDPRIDDEQPFLAEEAELLETLVTVVTNHVQRRTHLAALERSEELLTNAERLGEVGAWEVDLDTCTVYWTAGARRIHGMSEEFDLTFETALDFFHASDRETVVDAIESSAESGDSFNLEARVQTVAGDVRWVHMRGEALEATERPYVVRGYVQDITERKERSRRYEAMFNQSYQFSGLLEPDGTVIEANQRALDFGGLERKEVIGKPIWELEWWQLDEATQQGVKEAVDRAADGEFVRYEVEVQAGDETAVIDFSIRPITDEDGTVRSLIPEGRDITERTEREEELSALKDRYQTLLDAAPAPVFVANAATGEIVEVNTAAERLVGESREQIVGQRQSKLHPPEKSALYRKAFQEQVRTGQTVSRLADGSRLELRTADGDTVPIEISASTVSLPDGVVIFGIFRDVSKAVEDEP